VLAKAWALAELRAKPKAVHLLVSLVGAVMDPPRALYTAQSIRQVARKSEELLSESFHAACVLIVATRPELLCFFIASTRCHGNHLCFGDRLCARSKKGIQVSF